MSRRSVRIIDFDVSGSCPGSTDIRCVQLGRTSQQVVVSGDDKKNVSLWRLTKATAVVTFQGHSSDITAVSFSQKEDYVYSGSAGGTVLVWDLNQQKAAFSLNSHRAACTALAPYPASHQTLLASGSADCTLKIWDLRKKHCAQTFKGHEGKINTLAFSPDCRWVASGGDDGCIKIWDCAASKKLFDLKPGDAGVTVLKFNPTNMSLAAGYQDRVVRYWNLETQGLESMTSLESLPIQQICFEPKTGAMLFSASTNSLKLWQIEQGFLCDSIDTDWRQVGDLDISQVNEVLIGLSYGSGTFSAYTTDLSTVRLDIPPREELKVDLSEVRRPRKKEVSVTSNKPVGISSGDFMQGSGGASTHTESLELHWLVELQEEHKPIVMLLDQRTKMIKELAGLWASGHIVETLRAAEGLKDHSILTSVLEEGVISGSAVLTLDTCPGVISLAQGLIENKYEPFVKVGLKTVSFLLSKFFDIISSVLSTPAHGGVDLSREDRLRKCERCFNAFLQIQANSALGKTCSRTNEAGALARGLSEELSRFVWKCGKRE